MSEDKLTPYQLKQGMTYVKNVPDFLKNLMGDHKKPDIRDKIRHEDNEDDHEEEKDDFLSEKVEERPQIVVLNEEKHLNEYELKKHYVAQGKLKPEVEVKEELKDLPEEEKTAAVDKDGRILFRSKKRKSDIENSKEGDKVDKMEKTDKNKKDTKKKKKKQVPLSFDEE
ncbi:hypothetical protein K502DRAFT_339259 [Neoconidiobolus thromboides FSU 785]|nr:hypothetical protein K502DRAFT_339259 [Neoconidiobolus thromboides FSU 785]